MELVEFLLARVAEDEAVARAATPGPWEWDRSPGGEWGHQPPDLVTVAKEPPYSDGSAGPVGYVISSWGHDADGVEVSDEDAAHLARWDPTRVLAECKAKWRLIAATREFWDNPQKWDAFGNEGEYEHLILSNLALPYADHADYDPEWKP